jgi:hypothetical protein
LLFLNGRKINRKNFEKINPHVKKTFIYKFLEWCLEYVLKGIEKHIMLPITFIIVAIALIVFIVFATKQKGKGNKLGEQ